MVVMSRIENTYVGRVEEYFYVRENGNQLGNVKVWKIWRIWNWKMSGKVELDGKQMWNKIGRYKEKLKNTIGAMMLIRLRRDKF